MATQLPSNLQQDHPTISAILRPVWRRLNTRNEHWVHTIVGREGIGKSLTALRLGLEIDQSFGADQVYFRPADLLRDLRDGEYQQGDVYILDEAGVGLGRRTWQDSGQKRLNQALQLIRNHNIGLIFTLPRLSELDSQAQGRLHSYYEIRHKHAEEYVSGAWRWMDPDRVDITGDVFRKPPTYEGAKLRQVKFGPPEAPDVVDAYEARKAKFQAEFYDEAIAALEGEEGDGGDDDATDPHEIAERIRENGGPDTYIREINGGTQQVLDADEIALEYGVGDRKAKKVKKLLLDDIDREGLL
jgi:hypothetical protein